ncbi:MAG: hypothetical protein RLZ98_3187 [Pseudomonadota bacterium]|jgi:carboxylesterase
MSEAETNKIDFSEFLPGGRVGFLLIHGLGGTPHELRFVARGLAHAGHTVYCCQLAGHCGSLEELRTSTWKDWYASVEAAHDKLLEHCDIVIAGGLSMGAVLALRLAQQRPDKVHGLTLFAPTLVMDGWAMPWHSIILRYIRPTPFNVTANLTERPPYGIKDERIRSFVVKSMLSGDASQAGVYKTPVRCFSHHNLLVSDVRKHLAEIKAPTLILHPREDDMASLSSNALELQRKLGGLVELVVLDDSYHIVVLDRQRHIVVDRSIAFADMLEKRLARAREMAVLRHQRVGETAEGA